MISDLSQKYLFSSACLKLPRRFFLILPYKSGEKHQNSERDGKTWSQLVHLDTLVSWFIDVWGQTIYKKTHRGPVITGKINQNFVIAKMRIKNSEDRLYRFVLYKTPSFLRVAKQGRLPLCPTWTVSHFWPIYWSLLLLFWIFRSYSIDENPYENWHGLKINASFCTIAGIRISLTIWLHLLVVSNQQHVSTHPECIESPPGNTTNKSKANDKPANPTHACSSTYWQCQLFKVH